MWFILGPCTPYSEFACRIAAAKAGLKLGSKSYDFLVHSNSDGVKGCYTYKSSSKYHGSVFYNLGAHPDYSANYYTTDISDPIPEGSTWLKSIYRPDGFNCTPEGKFYIKFHWKFQINFFWFWLIMRWIDFAS